MSQEEQPTSAEEIQVLTGADVQTQEVREHLWSMRDEFLNALCTDNDGDFDDERYAKQEKSTLDSMNDHIKNKRTTILKIDGEIAATGSYHQVGMKDGRPVYEMAKVLVVSKYQGRGLYPKLIDIVEQQVKDLYPDHIDKAPIFFSQTRHKRVIEERTSRGWDSIPYVDGLKILGKDLSNRDLDAESREFEEKGYKHLLFDPYAQE